ncbi:MAG: DUF72 domain-containing protein [Candidatus Omnitrophota bacterium]
MIYVGTSGWDYSHWKGVFYPQDIPKTRWLNYYTEFFNCVELNVTFYRLVNKETFLNWRRKTPADFHFVAKGPRFITHVKRLKGISQSLDLFINNALGLEEKLALVLWQLPPNFKKDMRLLADFFKLLKKSKLRNCVEFRNETWFDKEVYELFKEYNFSLCIAHSPNFPCYKLVTAEYIYLRFHGGEILYGSNYSDRELRDWAKFARGFKKDKDIFAFFNNDAQGFAVKNALRFKELLD